MSQSMSLNSQNKYEIKICGQLGDSWLVWFGDVKVPVEIVVDDSHRGDYLFQSRHGSDRGCWPDTEIAWIGDRVDIHSESLDITLPEYFSNKGERL